MSSSEDNKAAVRDCFDNAARGSYEALPQIVTEDYVLHPEQIRGADGLRELVSGYRAAISGLTVTVDHQFTEGDHVATRFTLRGRHDGELMGTPPTGNAIEVCGLTISRCRDGRIDEEWELLDVSGLLEQIGAQPAMAPG
jgi:steroid delta-isomerase-like uncharacterized protein